MNSCSATTSSNLPHTAPLVLTACCWALETLLAQLVAFFDALEHRLPSYAALMVLLCLPWSCYRLGWWSGLVSTIPLGLSVALSIGVVVVVGLVVLGLALWLFLLLLHAAADAAGWRLPPVLEQHPVVRYWLENWHRLERQPKRAVQGVAWLVIGLLLGCWLESK